MNTKEQLLDFFEYADFNAEQIYQKTYSDKNQNWQHNFFRLALKKAKSIDDYCAIAGGIGVFKNEEQLIRDIYHLTLQKLNQLFYHNFKIKYKRFHGIWMIRSDHWARVYITIAESIIDNLDDKEWAKDIYQLAISRAKEYDCIDDIVEVIESICNKLKDKTLIKSLYTDAIHFSELGEDYATVAESVINSLNDFKWGWTIYHKAIKEAGDYDNYMSIAESIALHRKDQQWARLIYKKALTATSSFDDYIVIAESIIHHLQDKTWSKSIYKTAMNHTECLYDYIPIIESIAQYSDDKFLKTTIQKTIKLATQPVDYCLIAEFIMEHLADKVWCKKLYKKAVEQLKKDVTVGDAILIAESIVTTINDLNYAKKVYEMCLDKITLPSEFKELNKSVKKYIDDDSWQQQVIQPHSKFNFKSLIFTYIIDLLFLAILPTLITGGYWLINYFCGRTVGIVESITIFSSLFILLILAIIKFSNVK